MLATFAISAATPSRAETAPEAACDEVAIAPAQIRCLLDAAEAAGDPGVCERADDRSVRFNCLSLYAEHKIDAAPCRRIDGADARETEALQGACVSGVAIAGRNPDMCARAGVAAIRDACYMTLVMQHGADPAVCARIETPALKAACRE